MGDVKGIECGENRLKCSELKSGEGKLRGRKFKSLKRIEMVVKCSWLK